MVEMNSLVNEKVQKFILRKKAWWFYLIVITGIIVGFVLQDYLYSRLKSTGFYLSENLLYHTFWLYFIPFSLLLLKIKAHVNLNSPLSKFIFYCSSALVIALMHIFISTYIFVLVSELVYKPPHSFARMIRTVLSNHLFITFLWYSIVGLYFRKSTKPIENNRADQNFIWVKKNLLLVQVPVKNVYCILTDKPYTMIYTKDEKLLDKRSLKEFGQILNEEQFKRVHRSCIININSIKTIKSRRNGDYDAVMMNGLSIRLSRHYRSNWEKLLHLAS